MVRWRTASSLLMAILGFHPGLTRADRLTIPLHAQVVGGCRFLDGMTPPWSFGMAFPEISPQDPDAKVQTVALRYSCSAGARPVFRVETETGGLARQAPVLRHLRSPEGALPYRLSWTMGADPAHPAVTQVLLEGRIEAADFRKAAASPNYVDAVRVDIDPE